MATFNHASRGITKDILIAKGQGLLDREYNDRMNCFCAQLFESTFVCWNFVKENLGEDSYGWPWSELPQFHRVCKVTICSFLGNKYIKCSFCFCECVGIPCRHMFCVTN